MPVLRARDRSQADHRRASPCILFALSIVGVRSLGLEFLPKLEEGNLWVRATMPSTISLEEGNDYVNRMRRDRRRAFPRSNPWSRSTAAPTTAPTPPGFFNAEFFTPLKPFDQWRKGVDKDALTDQMLAS